MTHKVVAYNTVQRYTFTYICDTTFICFYFILTFFVFYRLLYCHCTTQARLNVGLALTKESLYFGILDLLNHPYNVAFHQATLHSGPNPYSRCLLTDSTDKYNDRINRLTWPTLTAWPVDNADVPRSCVFEHNKHSKLVRRKLYKFLKFTLSKLSKYEKQRYKQCAVTSNTCCLHCVAAQQSQLKYWLCKVPVQHSHIVSLTIISNNN